jgi:hypothetical protein
MHTLDRRPVPEPDQPVRIVSHRRQEFLPHKRRDRAACLRVDVADRTGRVVRDAAFRPDDQVRYPWVQRVRPVVGEDLVARYARRRERRRWLE